MKKIIGILIIIAVVAGGIYGGLRYKAHIDRLAAEKAAQIKAAQHKAAVEKETQALLLKGITIPLNQENKSGQSGIATLKQVNGKTVVTIELKGFTKGVSQPAHIHVGACPGVGSVKYPLTTVVDGASTTTLDVPLSQLFSQLPLALNVHKSSTQSTVYTACGPLTKIVFPH